jgi:hypothetical protein
MTLLLALKKKMQQWAGNNPKSYPHAARYGFEAWLIPFWHEIQRIADTAIGSRGASPEKIDYDNPPSRRIRRTFQAGSCRGACVKTPDAPNSQVTAYTYDLILVFF